MSDLNSLISTLDAQKGVLERLVHKHIVLDRVRLNTWSFRNGGEIGDEHIDRSDTLRQTLVVEHRQGLGSLVGHHQLGQGDLTTENGAQTNERIHQSVGTTVIVALFAALCGLHPSCQTRARSFMSAKRETFSSNCCALL